jgi:hypothetical protein
VARTDGSSTRRKTKRRVSPTETTAVEVPQPPAWVNAAAVWVHGAAVWVHVAAVWVHAAAVWVHGAAAAAAHLALARVGVEAHARAAVGVVVDQHRAVVPAQRLVHRAAHLRVEGTTAQALARAGGGRHSASRRPERLGGSSGVRGAAEH